MPDRTTLELRLLRSYGGAATVLLTFFALSAFRQTTQRARFTEIDVERINLVEKTGSCGW